MSLTNFRVRGRVMGFKATFNDISVISWWSVLLVEDLPGVAPVDLLM